MGIDQYNLTFGQNKDVHSSIDVDALALTQHLVDVMQMQGFIAKDAANHTVSVIYIAPMGVATAHFQLSVLHERDGVCTPPLTFGVVRSQLKRYKRGKCRIQLEFNTTDCSTNIIGQ